MLRGSTGWTVLPISRSGYPVILSSRSASPRDAPKGNKCYQDWLFFFNKEIKQSWTTGSEAHVGANRPEIAQSNKGIHRLR